MQICFYKTGHTAGIALHKVIHYFSYTSFSIRYIEKMFQMEIFDFMISIAVDTTRLHNFVFHFFAFVLMHLVLLVMFVAQISTSFSIPVPRMCVLYRNFYCVFSCYLSPD
jgi:hypothetical protein